MTKSSERGKQGEDIAAEYLADAGFQIVERNWRCQHGEIDIVALDGGAVVVVEVKTRAGHAAGHPLEAVTPAKLARLRTLAMAWAKDHPSLGRRLRIDVVGITMMPDGVQLINHLESVVS